ncbi:MAG: DUF6056 family protein [Muribaculaceae bacterium]
MTNHSSTTRRWATYTIVAVGLLTFFICLVTPFSGDDWVYYDAAHGRNLLGWIANGVGHWLTTNGRLANIGFTPLLVAPKWLLSAVCAFFAALMYAEAARAAKVMRLCGGFALMTVLLTIALPWWDSMWMFDCQFNYVFAAALCLWAVRMLWHAPQKTVWRWLAAAVCLAAGMMHEAASLPLCIAGAVYLWAGGPRPDKLLATAFAIGTAVVTFSPGIWMRAVEATPPDDTLFNLLIHSDLAASFVAIGLLFMSVSAKHRQHLRRYLATTIGLFAVAAVVSMAISLASGIVGRSGWFAEIYAFIVIISFGHTWLERLKPAATLVALAIPLIQLLFVWNTQSAAYDEYQRYEQAYRNSKDGVVYIDYTRDDQWPALALNRIRGVLDPDDCYLHLTLRNHIDPAKPLPVVLPTEAQGISTDSILRCGDIITTTLPPDAVTRPDGLRLCHRNGREWVIQPYRRAGRQLYHLSSRQLDPGDR